MNDVQASSEDLTALFLNTPNLEELIARNVPGFNRSLLIALPQALPQLRVLDVAGAPGICDELLLRLKALKHLQTLDISARILPSGAAPPWALPGKDEIRNRISEYMLCEFTLTKNPIEVWQ